MALFPSTFEIGYRSKVTEFNPKDYDGDPRGLLWMYEPPNPAASYVIGIDPALGRTGWSRQLRMDDDKATNNSAVEVLRIGRNNAPDVQVAEWMGPCDAFEIGDIANALGRMYCGLEEDKQCKAILETYPGPGGMTYRRMTELGYTNFWTWEYYAEAVVTPSKSIGWTATQKSLRDLWVKCSRHINLKNVIFRSPFLVEQLVDAEYIPERGYIESPNNKDGSGHGDALRAFMLALWCARGWSMEMERSREIVQVGPPIDPQRTDMDMDEIMDHFGFDFMNQLY